MEKNVTYYLRQKGLCFKMPFLLLSFLEKGPIFPKMLLLRVTTYFILFFLTKEQKKKKESWDLLVSGCSGRAERLLPESKSISLDQASRLQASSIYLRITLHYIFETENYI